METALAPLGMMPWWAWSYVTIYFVAAIFEIAHNFRTGKVWWRSLGDIVGALCFLILILAFWHVPLRQAVGKAITLIFAFALVWNTYTMPQDLKETLDREKDVSPEEREDMENSALTVSFILVAPGYIFGAILCARALGF